MSLPAILAAIPVRWHDQKFNQPEFAAQRFAPTLNHDRVD
jgi:hypothetical protein